MAFGGMRSADIKHLPTCPVQRNFEERETTVRILVVWVWEFQKNCPAARIQKNGRVRSSPQVRNWGGGLFNVAMTKI